MEPVSLEDIANQVAAANADQRGNAHLTRSVNGRKTRAAGIKRLHEIIAALLRQFEQGIMYISPALFAPLAARPRCQPVEPHPLERRRKFRHAAIAPRLKRALPGSIEHHNIHLDTTKSQTTRDARNRVLHAPRVKDVIGCSQGDTMGLDSCHSPPLLGLYRGHRIEE